MSVDISQTPVDAIVPHGQPLVVDTELLENRCMHVVHGRGVLAIERLVSPLVTLPVCDSSSNSPAGEPVREDERIVISAFRSLC